MPDEPIEYGNNCSNCFDPDKTPEFLYARFSLIAQCPPPIRPSCRIPPNDRVFKLSQTGIYPCGYLYDGTEWRVHITLWRSPPAQGSFRLEDVDGNIYFDVMFDVCPDEGIVYHSDMVDCLGQDCAVGGIGVFTWTPQATEILEAINLAKGEDLFMELRPLPDGKLVYKFCRLKDATNIKILFEP